MRISRKFSSVFLAYFIGFLLNVIFGFYACRRNSSEARPKQELGIKNEIKQKSGSSDQAYLSSILYVGAIPPPSHLRRTTILNTLIEKFKYQSYLEIGQGRKEDNFDWVNCRKKIGVDPAKNLNAAFPMTSDEFFAINHDSFDLIFIDGLHQADQVERDILNSLNVLNSNGAIVVHDCNPSSEDVQLMPRQTLAWTGDVWKAWVKFRATRHDLKMYVVDVETGCGIIRRGIQETIKAPEQLTYNLLNKNKTIWLNLVDADGFLRDLKNYK